jgi:hypothetical protein
MDSVAKIFSCYNDNLSGVITRTHVDDFLMKMSSRVVASKDTYTLDEFYKLIVGIAQIEVTFSTPDIGDIVKSFFHLDQNGDGCISKGDLYTALIKLGVKPSFEDISILHTKLDFSNNGCPSLRDYTLAVTE